MQNVVMKLSLRDSISSGPHSVCQLSVWMARPGVRLGRYGSWPIFGSFFAKKMQRNMRNGIRFGSRSVYGSVAVRYTVQFGNLLFYGGKVEIWDTVRYTVRYAVWYTVETVRFTVRYTRLIYGSLFFGSRFRGQSWPGPYFSFVCKSSPALVTLCPSCWQRRFLNFS